MYVHIYINIRQHKRILQTEDPSVCAGYGVQRLNCQGGQDPSRKITTAVLYTHLSTRKGCPTHARVTRTFLEQCVFTYNFTKCIYTGENLRFKPKRYISTNSQNSSFF